MGKAEYIKKTQDYISWAVWASEAELKQNGKKVFQNPDAAGNLMYKRLEARLRTLPSGTRMVYGGEAINQHNITVVAFLDGDGSYIHYVVED